MNTEKLFQNAMWVAVVMVLVLGLEVTVWADEDDDEKAEMSDFVAAVYRGQGQYNMAGSIATGEGGVIMKRGSVWLTPHGQYQKVGSVYLTPDGGVVTCRQHLHRRGRGDHKGWEYLYGKRSNDGDGR